MPAAALALRPGKNTINAPTIVEISPSKPIVRRTLTKKSFDIKYMLPSIRTTDYYISST